MKSATRHSDGNQSVYTIKTIERQGLSTVADIALSILSRLWKVQGVITEIIGKSAVHTASSTGLNTEIEYSLIYGCTGRNIAKSAVNIESSTKSAIDNGEVGIIRVIPNARFYMFASAAPERMQRVERTRLQMWNYSTNLKKVYVGGAAQQ